MTLRLAISINSFWISASGQGQAQLFDGETVRDAQGFPYLPGRHLRGLLRHAVARLAAWDPALSGEDARLFGEERQGGMSRLGGLTVPNAELPVAIRTALAHSPDVLLEPFAMTALDPERGVAATGSLRLLRVAVPMTLHATLDWQHPEDDHPGWRDTLRAALPFIRAVGAHRHRGLGRALVTEAA